MSASNYLELKLLDHSLGTTSYTAPSNVYLALSTATIDDDASGTELSGNGYARQAITFAAASGGSVSSNATVTFPTATGSWGTISHWSIWDASTTGNLLFHGSFSASKAIATGDVLKVTSGDLTISVN